MCPTIINRSKWNAVVEEDAESQQLWVELSETKSDVIRWELLVLSRTVTRTQLLWLWASDHAWQGVARQLCDPDKRTIDGRWGWGALWPFPILGACLEPFKWQTLWRRHVFYVPKPNSILAPVSNVQMFVLKYTRQRACVHPSHHFNSGPWRYY